MRHAECYALVEESLAFNLLHAPDYEGVGDFTLRSERFELRVLLYNLRSVLHTPGDLRRIALADQRIDEAFALYEREEYGGRQLQEALNHIEMLQRRHACIVGVHGWNAI